MMKSNIYIDLDGVIIDTVDRIKSLKNSYPELSWEEFSKKVEWDKFLKESPIINDGISFIKESIDKNIVIITKTNCLEEQIAKINYLRGLGINNLIIVIPPKLWKTDFVVPKSNDFLIDDNYENILDWNEKGGKGILFQLDDKYKDCISINNLKDIITIIEE